MKHSFLQVPLEKRDREGSRRFLSQGREGAADFFSNDYLGLARNKVLINRVNERWNNLVDKQLGGTGSRLLSGNYELFEKVENQLCEVFQAESVLIFNSGYSANQSLLTALGKRGDVVLLDEYAHVCLKEGARLSQAKSYSFKHNDVEDLRKKIRNNRTEGNVFVGIESLYSMTGNFSPLTDIVEACEDLNAHLIVDEAHSTGVYGPMGGGQLIAMDLHHRVFARVYTFGKAMGTHGACVAGSKDLIDYLLNFANGFIYTTSLPPHTLINISEAFRYLEENEQIQEQASAKINQFTHTFKKTFETVPTSVSCIQPIHIGDNKMAVDCANHLNSNGFNVMAIRSPTVKKGNELLRISLHVHNTLEEISSIVMGLKAYFN